MKSRSRMRVQRRTSRGQVAAVMDRLRAAVRRVVRLTRSSVPEATDVDQDAFYGLSRLAGRGGVTPLVPLTSENVAIPPINRVKHDLESLLPPEAKELLESGVFKPDEREESSPLTDLSPEAWVEKGKGVFLGVGDDQYITLLYKLVAHGIVEFVDCPPLALQGIFGVPKKDLARLILNAVAANKLCNVPPSPGLPFIETLAKLCIPCDCQLFMSLLDLSDYYHGLVLPLSLRSLFGLPPISLEDGRVVYPRWVTLPMGWSWAVYLAQSAHRHQLVTRSPRFAAALSLEGPLFSLLRGLLSI